MARFDLIEYQEQARNTSAPKKLYELWDEVCRKYDKRCIGEYELSEMKDTIFPTLRHLCSLKNQIDGRTEEPIDLDSYRQSRNRKTVNE